MPIELHSKTHIDIYDRTARQHWAHHFGVTEERLRKAVTMVATPQHRRRLSWPACSVSNAANPLLAQLLIVREQVMRLMQVLVSNGTTYNTSAGEIARIATPLRRPAATARLRPCVLLPGTITSKSWRCRAR